MNLRTTLSVLLCLIFSNSSFGQCPWINFADETSTRLVLSTTFLNDADEKDLSVADFNNDGYDDVVVVRKTPFSSAGPKPDLLLINDNGVLKDSTNFYAPEFISHPTDARDVLVADLDGDTWIDVVVCNTFGQQPVYYDNLGNDSLGNWQGLAMDTTRLPFLTINPVQFCAVWAGDVNGDTYPDIYFSNYNPSGGCEDILLINDSTGHFTDETVARLGNLRFSAFGTSAEIHDMDNDGDNDIIKISTLYSVSPWNDNGVFLLFNDGTGHFSNWQQTNAVSPYMFTVGDINNDTKLDMYVVDDGQDRVNISNTLYPDSLIDFTLNVLSNSPRTTGFGGNIKFQDLDNDGDLDIGVASVDVDIPPCSNSRKFAILENTGLASGNLQDPLGAVTNAWNISNYDYFWIDINNDGYQDMIHGVCTGYLVFMQIPPIQIDSIVFTDISCNAANDGSITPVLSGGEGPYNFIWSNASTTSSLSNLSAGTYTCTITTANGCAASGSVTISEPSAITLTTSKSNVSCSGGSNGSANAVASGGSPTYTYSWNTNPAQSSQAITNLVGNTYTVIVTDENACTAQSIVSVNVPTQLLTFNIPTNPSSGQSDGSINLLVSGGINPYSYNWSTGAITEDIDSIPAGFYFCQVSDRNGCADIEVVTLSSPAFIQAPTANANTKYPGTVSLFDFDISVFPNPGNGAINLVFENIANGQINIEMLDLKGRLINNLMISAKEMAHNKVQFNVHDDVCNGLYVIRITSNSTVKTVKYLLER